MDVIREAENYLKDYGKYHKAVNHAQYMLEKIKARSAPSDKVTASYEITGIHVDHPTNTLNDLYEFNNWQRILEENMREIQHIQEVLINISTDGGCEHYKDILEMWYVKRLEKYEIAERLGYSIRSLYRAKEKAVKAFAVGLFGLTAKKVM